MKRPALTAPVVLVSLVILVLLIVSIVTVAKQRSDHPAVGTKHTAAEVTKGPSTTTKDTGSKSHANAAPQAVTSPADQAVAANSARAATDACKLFTINVAQKLLGASAAPSGTGGTAPLQLNGTAVTACAYSSGSGSAQLIVRTPTNRLGVSENATAFGSGRPAGAITVNGYGQTAYWDPAKHTLNILGDNNWYIISTSSNTQAGSEGVTKQLQSGF